MDEQTTDLRATLKQNRLLLKKLLNRTKEEAVVDKIRLQEAGFRFTYITHTQTTKTGAICYCCYDYGYCLLEDGRYLVIRTEDK